MPICEVLGYYPVHTGAKIPQNGLPAVLTGGPSPLLLHFTSTPKEYRLKSASVTFCGIHGGGAPSNLASTTIHRHDDA
jgi:hypothetical protein